MCFWPALDGSFVSDDRNAIVANAYVVGPLEPATIFTEFSAGWWGVARDEGAGYRPLVTLSFALNHALSGLAPRSYHAVNLALHGLVSWLVFLVAVRLGTSRPGALLAATVFCALPIHTEAVAWVVGRAELLTAAAAGAMLVCLIDYRRRGQLAAVSGAAALFVLGLFSKENAVTMLAAPLLLTIALPTRPFERRRDLVATAALAVGLLVYLGVRALAGPLLPSVAGDQLDNPLAVVELPARIAGAASVLGRYLQLTVWPWPLSVDYSYDALGIGAGFRGDPYGAAAVVACVALATAAWRTRSSDPAVTFGLLMAAATYSIVSNSVVLIGTIMGERLFYLPTFGLCVAAAPALARLEQRAGRKGLALVAVVALAWVVVDHARARAWRSPVALFEAATAVYPRSARAHMELGSAYGAMNRQDEAIEAFRAATAIKPDYAAAWYNLGNFHARRQQFDDALAAYDQAVTHAPRLTRAWHNLALVHRQRGRPQQAVAAAERASELSPADLGVWILLADLLLAEGRYAEAVPAYDEALELGATAATRINRGVAMQRLAGCDAALPDYLAALEAAPGHRTALANAVGCLQADGRIDEARALVERAEVATRHDGR